VGRERKERGKEGKCILFSLSSLIRYVGGQGNSTTRYDTKKKLDFLYEMKYSTGPTGTIYTI
jgi:hypothetical protein